MSKYVELNVKKAKEAGDIKSQAEITASILAADISGQIKVQEGKIIRKEAAFRKLEGEVEAAQLKLTDDTQRYLSLIQSAMSNRDAAAEDLQEARENLVVLEDLLKFLV